MVTGASSGIGFAIARELALRGYNLYMVSRSEKNISWAAERLRAETSVEIEAVATDLSASGSAQRLYERVCGEGRKIEILVNNAGMFIFRDVLECDAERIEQIMTLNMSTVAMLSRLFAADMAKCGGGHILNLSSYSVYMPLPGLAVYAATKSFVKTFSIAFDKEVRDRGVTVTAVAPAGVATDLYGLSHRMQRLGLKLGFLITPDNVARRSVSAMFRGRRYVVPDWWNRLWIPVLQNLGPATTRFIRRKTMKFQK